MTRSSNHPDADFTPNDIGPPDRVAINQPLTKEEREDYYEKLAEMDTDLTPF